MCHACIPTLAHTQVIDVCHSVPWALLGGDGAACPEDLLVKVTRTGGHVGFCQGWNPAAKGHGFMGEVTLQFFDALVRELDD
jgi:predicted alpha/beta-fold hydrolase